MFSKRLKRKAYLAVKCVGFETEGQQTSRRLRPKISLPSEAPPSVLTSMLYSHQKMTKFEKKIIQGKCQASFRKHRKKIFIKKTLNLMARVQERFFFFLKEEKYAIDHQRELRPCVHRRRRWHRAVIGKGQGAHRQSRQPRSPGRRSSPRLTISPENSLPLDSSQNSEPNPSGLAISDLRPLFSRFF